jgi:hypothetical protein
MMYGFVNKKGVFWVEMTVLFIYVLLNDALIRNQNERIIVNNELERKRI